MQINSDGTRYAASAFVDDHLFEVTLIEPSKDRFFVDMWKPDGDNHWNKTFTTIEAALAEYNRWAAVKEVCHATI